MNYFLQFRSSPDRQTTDRKWRIWSHRATCTGGLKNWTKIPSLPGNQIPLWFSQMLGNLLITSTTNDYFWSWHTTNPCRVRELNCKIKWWNELAPNVGKIEDWIVLTLSQGWKIDFFSLQHTKYFCKWRVIIYGMGCALKFVPPLAPVPHASRFCHSSDALHWDFLTLQPQYVYLNSW